MSGDSASAGPCCRCTGGRARCTRGQPFCQATGCPGPEISEYKKAQKTECLHRYVHYIGLDLIMSFVLGTHEKKSDSLMLFVVKSGIYLQASCMGFTVSGSNGIGIGDLFALPLYAHCSSPVKEIYMCM